jgi:hypothetical protein
LRHFDKDETIGADQEETIVTIVTAKSAACMRVIG